MALKTTDNEVDDSFVFKQVCSPALSEHFRIKATMSGLQKFMQPLNGSKEIDGIPAHCPSSDCPDFCRPYTLTLFQVPLKH